MRKSAASFRIRVMSDRGKAFLRLPDPADMRLSVRMKRTVSIVNADWGCGVYTPFFGVVVLSADQPAHDVLKALLGSRAEVRDSPHPVVGLQFFPRPYFYFVGKSAASGVTLPPRPVRASPIGRVLHPNLMDFPLLSVRGASSHGPGGYELVDARDWGRKTRVVNVIAALEDNAVSRLGLEIGRFLISVPRGWVRAGQVVYAVEIGEPPHVEVHLAIPGQEIVIAGFRAMLFAFSVSISA